MQPPSLSDVPKVPCFMQLVACKYVTGIIILVGCPWSGYPSECAWTDLGIVIAPSITAVQFLVTECETTSEACMMNNYPHTCTSSFPHTRCPLYKILHALLRTSTVASSYPGLWQEPDGAPRQGCLFLCCRGVPNPPGSQFKAWARNILFGTCRGRMHGQGPTSHQHKQLEAD